MAQWLERYRGREVEVHYLTDSSMYQDKGVLTDFGDGWLELTKNLAKRNEEVLAIPTSAIRLVKVHGLVDEAVTTLVRPASLSDEFDRQTQGRG